MKRFLLALVIGLASLPSHAVEKPAPYLMVRALQELQTQIVTGRTRARDDQPQMIADISRSFTAAPAEIWQDARNARATIVWLLSGGSPRMMRGILRYNTFPAEEARLARGVLAFAEGRASQAREILLGVDPRQLEASLGGQIALVQAALVLTESRERAIEYLGLARLLAPGTLVEETALRRQISVVGQTADAETFAVLSRQYARRFKASLYSEEFRETFANTFVRIGIAAPEDQVRKLKPILAGFDPDERCRLAVLLARATLVEGAWRSTEAFTETIMEPPVEKTCDVPRARLYRAAARAFRPDNDADLLALEKLDDARVTIEDRALRKASLLYARLVRSFPDAVEPDADAKAGLVGTSALQLAEEALASTVTLAKEKGL